MVVASIPNVKHWSVVLPLLLHDRWEYQAAGPLHFSNLRFFTMVEIAGVLRRAGLGTFDTCAAQQLPLEDEERLTPLLEAVAAYGVDVVIDAQHIGGFHGRGVAAIPCFLERHARQAGCFGGRCRCRHGEGSSAGLRRVGRQLRQFARIGQRVKHHVCCSLLQREAGDD